MKRGTIVAYSPELLPGFRYDCIYQPGFYGWCSKA
jgi:hypothetical protein